MKGTMMKPMSNLLLMCAIATLLSTNAHAEDPPKGKSNQTKTTTTLLSDEDQKMIMLERKSQVSREDLLKKLANVDDVLNQAAEDARLNLNRATEFRKKSEQDAIFYEQETFPQEVQIRRYNVTKEKALQESATASETQLRQAKANGDPVSENQLLFATFRLEEARNALEAAEAELELFEKFAGPQEVKKRKMMLNDASSQEVVKQKEYEFRKRELERRKNQSSRLKARTPEDLVLALLAEVVEKEKKIVDVLHEIGDVNSKLQKDRQHSAMYFEEINKKSSVVTELNDQIKSTLKDAMSLAEETRRLREALFDQEKLLIINRRMNK